MSCENVKNHLTGRKLVPALGLALSLLALAPAPGAAMDRNGGSPGPDGSRRSSVCIGNETNFPIAFEYRWRSGPWTALTQEPGETMRILQALPGRDLQVRFFQPNLSPDPSSRGADHRPEVAVYRLRPAMTHDRECSPRLRPLSDGEAVIPGAVIRGTGARQGNFNVFRLGVDGRLDLFRVP